MNLSSAKQKYIDYINKIIINNKVSHSYLIELNNYEEDFKFVLSFVKMILCNVTYDKLDSLNNNIISLIDDNNYPDVKIINPEGSSIKKSQLLDLQEDFSNKSLLGNKKIYIIKFADQLNVSSANTMLKFLEEPEDDIIAFLVTENRYRVIDTLISRCQILSLCDFNYFKCEDEKIVDLLRCFSDKESFFIKYNYFINDYIVDKSIAKEKITMIENIFINYLNFKYSNSKFDDELVKILDKIDNEKILIYLSIIEEELPKLDFNVNYKLWLDSLFSKFIIGGCI